MVFVEARALGRKRPLLPNWSVSLPSTISLGEPLALRRIIEFIVRHEVKAFQERQASQLFLSVLTESDIAAGAEQGRIRMGQPDQMNSSVDAEQAVDTAWQAFEDGMYLVVIDSNEMRDLDAPILLKVDSQIVFLRLTFLGGA